MGVGFMQEDNNQKKETKKTVTTTIICKFCGKEQEVSIEVPESTETPSTVWND